MNEAIKNILPKKDTWESYGSIEWRKKGGITGVKTLENIQTKLIALGFKKQGVSSKSTPTGSSMGFTSELRHNDGWKATLQQHFGTNTIYIATVEKEL